MSENLYRTRIPRQTVSHLYNRRQASLGMKQFSQFIFVSWIKQINQRRRLNKSCNKSHDQASKQEEEEEGSPPPNPVSRCGWGGRASGQLCRDSPTKTRPYLWTKHKDAGKAWSKNCGDNLVGTHNILVYVLRRARAWGIGRLRWLVKIDNTYVKVRVRTYAHINVSGVWKTGTHWHTHTYFNVSSTYIEEYFFSSNLLHMSTHAT